MVLKAKFTNVLGKVCVISKCVFAIPFVKLIDTKVITIQFTAVFLYQSQFFMRVLKKFNYYSNAFKLEYVEELHVYSHVTPSTM